jgi:hypothetical protein
MNEDPGIEKQHVRARGGFNSDPPSKKPAGIRLANNRDVETFESFRFVGCSVGAAVVDHDNFRRGFASLVEGDLQVSKTP